MSDPLEQLDDYVGGELSEDEALTLEEKLFEAAGRGEFSAEAQLISTLSQTLAEMAPRGTLKLGITKAELEELKQTHPKLAYNVIDIAKDSSTQVFPTDSDLFVAGYPLPDFRGSHVDFQYFVGAHQVKTVRDVPVDPETRTVYFTCEGEMGISAARAALRVTERVSVRVFDARAKEPTMLGECEMKTVVQEA